MSTPGDPDDAARPSYTVVVDLFHQLCDLPDVEQQAQLERLCGGDESLRKQVEAMLAKDAAADQPLDGLVDPTRMAALFTAWARSDRIGDYEILGELGRGGMGIVYEARQATPRRTVALKLIRPGFVTAELLQRFRNEAEVLGSLNHAGIAQVYEAGTAETAAGELPYIAMELVRGELLDHHVRQAALGVEEILELVVQLCDALHHAHQRGVVHRDLKPGNVLVTADGTPKVLDFGVARVVRTGPDTTARTRTGQLVGTLAYMSPEQVRADTAEISAQTDVYALGVMAYEMLTGTRPIDVDSRSLAEAALAIAEEEPLPLGLVDRHLRGDVEVIVSKAIAKEPERRYASAAAFAADVRRHLAHEPIHARPTSRLYQLRKFARRNKAVVGGVATAFLAMAAGTAIATWQAGVAHRARLRADREREVATIEAYRGTLAAAQGSLDAGNVAATERALERVPHDERNWEWQHLKSRLDRAAAVVESRGAVASALDADGRLVVVSRAGEVPGVHTVCWLEPYFTREQRSAALPPPDVRRIALSADGRRVAALHGPDSRRVTLWQLDPEGGLSRLLDGELDGFGIDLALSSDGETLAATSAGGVRIWRPGVPRPIFWEHGTTPRAITISASGSHVGLVHVVNGTGVYRVFDVAAGTASADLGREILSLALSPDGAFAATSEEDGVVRLRQATTGKVLERFRVSAADASVAAFDPQGRRLAAAGADGATRVWTLSGPLRGLVDGGIEGHHVLQPEIVLPGRPAVLQVAFDPEGRGLVTLESEGVTRLHEAAADRGATDLLGHTHHVVDVAVSPDSSRLVSGSTDETLRFWDGASGECYAALPYPDGLTTLSFSPDGRTLATGHRGEVRLLDPARPLDARRLEIGDADVLALSFAPHGSRLATLDAEGRTRVWKADDWKANDGALLFEVPSGPLRDGDVAFSPSGRYLATSAPGELLVLDAASGARVEAHRVEGARLHALAWLAPAEVVASGWSDGAIRLFEPDTGDAGVVMRSSNGAILSLAPFSDGSRLAVGSERGVIEVWDVATRRMTLELGRSGGGVHSLAVFPDGSRLVGAASDATISVWDTVPTRARRSAAACMALLQNGLRARVLEHFAETADPVEVAEILWRDGSLGEQERRAALRWTVAPPLPDHGARHDPYDGYALALDGADQHVLAVGGDEALRMTDAFTIEAWIRPSAEVSRIPSGRAAVQLVLNKEGEYQIAVWPDGELRWLIAGPDGWLPYWLSVRYSVEPGHWTHVALVRDGAEIRFHVNGRQVQTFQGPERIGDHHPAMNELRIGGRQHTPSGFAGEIDEVRVWNVVRTEAQILSTLQHSPFPDEPGLVSAWSFDDGAGSVARDVTGRHPGRLNGPSWRATALFCTDAVR